MRKATWILLVVLIALQATGYSQVSNKDEMIKKIFEVLKNKDEKGFIKLFPDAATLKKISEQLMARELESDTTGKIKEILQREFDAVTDSVMAARFGKEFKRYIDKGEKKGIEWSKIVFVSYTSDSSVKKMMDEFLPPELTGKIYFTFNSKEYFLAFGDVVFFDKGWYGVAVSRIDEKSRENEKQNWDEDEITTDGEVSTAPLPIPDSTKAPVKTQSSQNPKQPVKNQPAKSKSQSPAKKSD